MKPIDIQDVQQLRKKILQKHDLIMEHVALTSKTRNKKPAEMLAQLDAAEKKLDRLLALPHPPTGADVRVQKLHQELTELRVFFGAPTGRPLEDRGVDFIAPYVKSMRLLFQIDSAMALYVEAVRTELALLEYRMEREEDFSERLLDLADSIGLWQYRAHFSGIQDSHVFDLGHYLMLIHELLQPVLFDWEESDLRGKIALVYLEMSGAFATFSCEPEEVEDSFLDAFILSMTVALFERAPSQYIAQRCKETAIWLQNYPLESYQQEQAGKCYKKALEVLQDA